MGTDEVEMDILNTLESFSNSDEVNELAGKIAGYIHQISLINTLTPQEVLSLIFLVNATIHTQYIAMFENYLVDFCNKFSDGDDENE